MSQTLLKLQQDGFAIVPIMPGRKQPADTDWLNKAYALEDFPADSNVGVKNGEPSGWRVDVDLDVKEAIDAAQILLPETGLVHGRPGKKSSHWWFIAPGAPTKAYKDLDGTMLVELRSSGGQTVVPPSVHTSGELLAWERDRGPMTVTKEDLLHAVRAVAIASLFGRHWPGGSRHHAALNLSGFLLRLGFDGPWVERIVLSAAKSAGDEESGDRARAARDTASKHANGGKTTGGPKLAEVFARGDELAARVYQWMEREGDDQLDLLNERHFVAELSGDMTVGTEDADREPSFQTFEAFRLRYYNQRVGKTKLGEWWLSHHDRRSYRRVVFAPPPLTCHPEDFNLWRGFAHEPDPAPQPEQRCALFLDHLYTIICNGDKSIYKYLLDLLALTVQAPGRPTGVAVVLRGDQGAGKGTFLDQFGSLFGSHYIQVDKQVHVTGRFNTHLSGKVVLFADEAVWGGNKQEVGALRRLVTERTLTIERKYLNAATEPNCLHVFMATNEEWVWPAALKERRGFILDVEKKAHTNRAYFDAIYDEWQGGGAQAFLAFLQQYPAPTRIGPIPATAALAEQQDLSFDPVHSWWKDKLVQGEIGDDAWPSFAPSRFLFNDYAQHCKDTGTRLRYTETMFARKLKELLPHVEKTRQLATFNTARFGPPNIVTKQVMGYVMPPLPQCRAYFDKFSGVPVTWPDADYEQMPFEVGDRDAL